MIAGVGDTLESAIWLDGRETPQDAKRFRDDTATAMAAYCLRYGRKIGPISWSEKKPGEDRVPSVPSHIQGPNVRLLVAEAVVTDDTGIKRELPGFAHDLEPKDRAILRRITRKRYEEAYPGYPRPNNRQIDTLINDLGLEVALETLEKAPRSALH